MISKVWVITVSMYNFDTIFLTLDTEFICEPDEVDIVACCKEAREKHGKYRCVAEIKERYLYKEE